VSSARRSTASPAPLPDTESIVADVAGAVGLAEGTRGVATVLSALARLEPVSIRALGRAADLPVPIVAAICGELRKRGLVSETRPAQLTIEGRRRFAAAPGPAVDAGCPTCGGRGIALPQAVAKLRRGLARIAEEAPAACVELDQCHCTPKTKLRRVLALHAADAIANKRILLLGDDDLISVALAGFAEGLPIAELTVVDVDRRVLAFVESQLRNLSVPLQTVHHDLHDPLPPRLTGRFDTVVTDPPYSSEGARLFLTRAVEALAGEGSDVFFSFGSRRPRVQFELQRSIVDAGLEIRALTRDFNDYVGAGAIGGTSHLYHLRAAALEAVSERDDLLEEELLPRRPPVVGPRDDLPRIGDLDVGTEAVLLDVVRGVEVDRDLAWMPRVVRAYR
jgi:N4-bis(aminopropyl)spermidine synthase